MRIMKHTLQKGKGEDDSEAVGCNRRRKEEKHVVEKGGLYFLHRFREGPLKQGERWNESVSLRKEGGKGGGRQITSLS